MLTLDDGTGDFEVVHVVSVNDTDDGFIIERGDFDLYSPPGSGAKTWAIGTTVFSDISQVEANQLSTCAFHLGNVALVNYGNAVTGSVTVLPADASTHFVLVDGSGSTVTVNVSFSAGGRPGPTSDMRRAIMRIVLLLKANGTAGTTTVEFTEDVLWTGTAFPTIDTSDTTTVWKIELEQYADGEPLIGRWAAHGTLVAGGGSGSGS